jgi:membrane protease YdiL (CAAX protease family)
MLSTVLAVNWSTPFLIFALFGAVRYFYRGSNVKGEVNWTWPESIGVTLAIYFVSQVIGGLLVYAVPMLLGGWSTEKTTSWLDKNAFGQFFLILVIEALTLGLLYLFINRRGANFHTLGLKKPHWRDLGYVALGFVIYFAGYILILGALKQVVHIDTNQQQQLGFDTHPGNSALPFIFLALVVLPPVVEELLVRGFLYSGLRKGLPLIWAVLLTSAIFATAHLQAGSGQPLLWSAAIDTFILSLVLIYLKEKTGSLYACIGLHMLKNFVAFMGLFVFHLM